MISESERQFLDDFEILQDRNLEAEMDEIYTVGDCKHQILYSDNDAGFIDTLLLIKDDYYKEKSRRDFLSKINHENNDEIKVAMIREFAQKLMN